jgi:hypothetical protein
LPSGVTPVRITVIKSSSLQQAGLQPDVRFGPGEGISHLSILFCQGNRPTRLDLCDLVKHVYLSLTNLLFFIVHPFIITKRLSVDVMLDIHKLNDIIFDAFPFSFIAGQGIIRPVNFVIGARSRFGPVDDPLIDLIGVPGLINRFIPMNRIFISFVVATSCIDRS